MLRSDKKIEIVRSTTKGLGSMGKVSSESIHAVLTKHFTNVKATIVNDLSDVDALVSRHPDLVFLGMEFVLTNPALGVDDPQKVWLSDVLDRHEIAHTGSTQAAHELGRNKPLAKQRIIDLNLKTSAFFVIKQCESLKKSDITLDFPLFIKPASGGGGNGIDSNSVVNNFEQARLKVQSITTGLKSDALIEQYLPGREFSVAILKDSSSPNFLALPIELIAPPDENGSRLLSGSVKSSNSEQALKVSDKVLEHKLKELALSAFHALGGRDFGRIDIRLDSNGTPHFLEVNFIPSLISGYGSFPKACVLNASIEHEPMIMKIVDLGLARNNIMTISPSLAANKSVFLS